MDFIVKKQLKIIRDHIDFYSDNAAHVPPYVYGELISQLNTVVVNCERFDEKVEENIGTNTVMRGYSRSVSTPGDK